MNSADTKAGIAGGMLLTMLSTIRSGDLVKTIVLSAVGAAVSYIVTMGCRKILGKRK